MDIFEKCNEINDLLYTGNDSRAREELIKLLDVWPESNFLYPELVNKLVREVGLYPYIDKNKADWEERYVLESFMVDTGEENPVTLHREQSAVLNKLLNGSSLALSAPTSFGKSFIIDAFISIKKPKNVMIIVPTIALTDETRRRINVKFGHIYKIITTSECDLSEKNIFIFPQERAVNYISKLNHLDLLIVDEFYKASPDFDKERSPALLKAITKLGNLAKQRYFLAPNISSLNENIFTRNMEFLAIDFNTVVLKKFSIYEKIKNDYQLKEEALLNVVRATRFKTLVYAGTFTEIEKVASIFIQNFAETFNKDSREFSDWLIENYDPSGEWQLCKLVKRNVGIHTGRLHRSLSQIQVKLFESELGLQSIISTSSIVEGVNTSAKNIILWKNKNGGTNLNDFTYRNIIGRGGRMFRHFVGHVYILEQPPEPIDNQLNLSIPDSILDESILQDYYDDLKIEQVKKILEFKRVMDLFLGEGVFADLQRNGYFERSDNILLRKIAHEIYTNPEDWKGLGYLNSRNADDWEHYLYKVLKLQTGWGTSYTKIVKFVKVISRNWTSSIPELIEELKSEEIGLDEFFNLERNVTFKLSSLMNDINTIQRIILKEQKIDISSFVSKLSHAFLPPVVYQLEEYGLPRMISRKISNSNFFSFNREDLTIHQALDFFRSKRREDMFSLVKDISSFDRNILNHFYDGIR